MTSAYDAASVLSLSLCRRSIAWGGISSWTRVVVRSPDSTASAAARIASAARWRPCLWCLYICLSLTRGSRWRRAAVVCEAERVVAAIVGREQSQQCDHADRQEDVREDETDHRDCGDDAEDRPHDSPVPVEGMVWRLVRLVIVPIVDAVAESSAE